MFGSTILDVAIGLVFIYCLYSLLATTIKEIIASVLNLRANKLERAIERMLVDPHLSDILFNRFYEHPMIKYMNDGGWHNKKPSYISSAAFSKALVDILVDTPETQTISTNAISDGLKTLTSIANNQTAQVQSSDTIRLLESFLADSGDDILKFKALIEQWFNEMMERATGWYKRQTQWIIFLIGLGIAIAFNASTVGIATHLMNKGDKGAREGLAKMASSYIQSHPQSTISSPAVSGDTLVKNAINLYNNDIQQSNQLLGLGWGKDNNMDCSHWFINILGWLITALAISLGAPFWFDILNQLVKLRGTGPKPKGTKKASGTSTVTVTQQKV